MQLDSRIVQMSTCHDWLLVSTLTRSYLCDTVHEQYRQIGKKLRDGHYGSCFVQNKRELHKIERMENLTKLQSALRLDLANVSCNGHLTDSSSLVTVQTESILAHWGARVNLSSQTSSTFISPSQTSSTFLSPSQTSSSRVNLSSQTSSTFLSPSQTSSNAVSSPLCLFCSLPLKSEALLSGKHNGLLVYPCGHLFHTMCVRHSSGFVVCPLCSTSSQSDSSESSVTMS
ncbi:uncharacterized protein LOC103517868 [Diaphorina citri]|uniref:Uncharacterized protein LOC103517868 n=1 Tax=Diaphorina citri TaxID=121845 RepID=A0A3Q0JG00_DIACI|nr:uncharacterized protein LOC103517868 [Diaphorina citri]